MADHQIPAVIQNIAHIALIVGAREIGWQQVTTHCVMPKSSECFTHGRAVFAGNKNSQLFEHRVCIGFT